MEEKTPIMNVAAFIWHECGIQPEIRRISARLCEYVFECDTTEQSESVRKFADQYYKTEIYQFIDKKEELMRKTKEKLL